MPEAVRTFGQVNGRDLRYVQVPWDEFRRAAGEKIARMYEWFGEEGDVAEIPTLREEYLDLATFEQYLRQSG